MGVLQLLEGLKNFLADRPDTAFLAISLFVNAFLFKAYAKARDEHTKSLESLLPLAASLSEMLKAAAAKSKLKARGYPPMVSSDSGIRERE